MSGPIGDNAAEKGKDENREPRPDKTPGDPAGRDDTPSGLDPEECLRKYPELSEELKKLFKGISHLSVFDKDGYTEGIESRGKKYQVIGDFKILREIGSGGMARVFEAEQISLKRRVALKVLPPYLSLSETAVQKFLREAEAAGRQRHPGIVTIHAVGEQDGLYYIAQELVEGGTSFASKLDVYRKGESLPQGYFRKAAKFIAEVADALQHAHATGVIHRDIKPSNILINRDGHPLISDFGLARVEDALALSRSGEFAGTPYYMSPEQAAGLREEIDHRSDIFSLGVTLYETLILERPFDSDKSQEVIKRVLYHEPKDPHMKNPRIPRDLAVICLKAMEKDPQRRYQTMDDLAGDLRRFLLGESIIARPTGRIRKTMKWIRGHKILTIAVAASIVAVLATANLAYVTFHQYRRDQRSMAERYKPIKKALDYANVPKFGHPRSWCIPADPSDPGGYLLEAILALDHGEYEETLESLENCRARCLKPDQQHMEMDARYLMKLASSRLEIQRKTHSGNRPPPSIQSGLSLDPADEFDPLSIETVVWHYPEQPADKTGNPEWFQRPILLNTDHYLVHLFKGVFLFQILFRGGERYRFQDAIDHLEDVLDSRPDNIPALITLGRVQYFLARFYNLFDLLEDACRNLDKAIDLGGDSPYFMAHTTYGQICLLRGELEHALVHFNHSLQALEGLHQNPHPGINPRNHVHNAYRGKGDVYVRQGHFDEALAEYEEGLKVNDSDVNLNVSLAEIYLFRNELVQARRYAEKGTMSGPQGLECRVASIHLLCSRVLIKIGEYEEATNELRILESVAYPSPRDQSLVCQLVASLPEKVITNNLRYTASSLAKQIIANPDSPICQSGHGAFDYLSGRYDEAIEHFSEALSMRKNWHVDVRKYYWFDDARDHYFLSMVYFKLENKEKTMEHYEKAESLRPEDPNRFYDYWDILDLVREKARKTLGISDGSR